jgi:hypothetical protein
MMQNKVFKVLQCFLVLGLAACVGTPKVPAVPAEPTTVPVVSDVHPEPDRSLTAFEQTVLDSGLTIERYALLSSGFHDVQYEMRPQFLEGDLAQVQTRHISEREARFAPLNDVLTLPNGSTVNVEEIPGSTVDSSSRVVVTVAGKLLFQVETGPSFVRGPFERLISVDDTWFLELVKTIPDQKDPNGPIRYEGMVYQEALDLNAEYGYRESFGIQSLAGKVFYFFDRDGRIGISYDGQETDLGLTEVYHYNCCSPAWYNPRAHPDMVSFYGRADDQEYYFEIGVFKD